MTVIPAEEITEKSWHELMRAVRLYVGRRVPSPDDRDDLVQDVLLRIYRGLPSLKGRTSPGPWVYGIARNVIVDYWRKQGRRITDPIEEAEIALAELPDPSDNNSLEQSIAAYLAALVTKLASPYRETLTLTELKGMKYVDAARQLGVSLAAVKSRVLRGREILRQALVRCCEIELGATGQVIDCMPRHPNACGSCDASS